MKIAGNGYFLKSRVGVCCWNLVTLSLHPRPDPVQLQFCNFVLNYASKILSIAGDLFGSPSGGGGGGGGWGRKGGAWGW